MTRRIALVTALATAALLAGGTGAQAKDCRWGAFVTVNATGNGAPARYVVAPPYGPCRGPYGLVRVVTADGTSITVLADRRGVTVRHNPSFRPQRRLR